ncbi:hypothetical protein [Agarilytica rhodophyticola]|uniref:hypothetical protein n=1 Tax=Agarilytica rhodophyticola TaxID=1737490 RepID=UPI000CD94D5C|nr:hypothetical protein [Agarilytica rhodophyticola]
MISANMTKNSSIRKIFMVLLFFSFLFSLISSSVIGFLKAHKDTLSEIEIISTSAFNQLKRVSTDAVKGFDIDYFEVFAESIIESTSVIQVELRNNNGFLVSEVSSGEFISLKISDVINKRFEVFEKSSDSLEIEEKVGILIVHINKDQIRKGSYSIIVWHIITTSLIFGIIILVVFLFLGYRLDAIHKAEQQKKSTEDSYSELLLSLYEKISPIQRGLVDIQDALICGDSHTQKNIPNKITKITRSFNEIISSFEKNILPVRVHSYAYKIDEFVDYIQSDLLCVVNVNVSEEFRHLYLKIDDLWTKKYILALIKLVSGSLDEPNVIINISLKASKESTVSKLIIVIMMPNSRVCDDKTIESFSHILDTKKLVAVGGCDSSEIMLINFFNTIFNPEIKAQFIGQPIVAVSLTVASSTEKNNLTDELSIPNIIIVTEDPSIIELSNTILDTCSYQDAIENLEEIKMHSYIILDCSDNFNESLKISNLLNEKSRSLLGCLIYKTELQDKDILLSLTNSKFDFLMKKPFSLTTLIEKIRHVSKPEYSGFYDELKEYRLKTPLVVINNDKKN